MIEKIPNQLKKEEFGFCEVREKDKKPFRKNWQKEPLKHNSPQLDQNLNNRGNVGAIAGIGRLRMVDVDNELKILEFDKIFGDTFSIRTGSGKKHYYVITDYDTNHVFANKIGEFRAKNMQCLIPPSIHPNGQPYVVDNDIPIKEYSKEEIEELLKPYISDNENYTSNTKEDKPTDTSRSGKEWSEVYRLIKKAKTKEEVFKEMMAFKKWAEAPEQYRELTYKKAVEEVENKAKSKDDKEKEIKETKGLLDQEITELFTDQDGTPYATVKIQNHLENWQIQSRPFKNFITKIVYEVKGKPPSNNTITSLQNIFSAKAMFEGKQYDVFLRAAYVNETVYIDIGDKDWNILKITPDSIQIIQEQVIKFKRFRHMKPIIFDLNAEIKDINLILKHVPLQDEEDKILYKTYLALLFLEKIPTVILIVFGPQGSGKTVVLKFTRSLADPSSLGMLSLAKNIKELVQQVSHHYLPFYDNVSYINKTFSDFLCRAVTGEGYSKRELYTDDEDIIYNYRRKVAMNGINLPGQEADFLDRCLTIHLARINKKFRRTEEDLWRDFEIDRPKITGAILKVVQKSLQKIKEIKIDNLPRMADYTKWGEAISQVLGEEPGKFTDTYFNKIDKLNKEALEANPIGICIAELMDNFDTWGGTPTELLDTLTPIAETLRLDKNPQWPKGSQVLTRKINEISSNLEDEGIKFEFGHTGKRRFIKLTKETVNTVSTVKNEENDGISEETIKEIENNSVIDDTKEVLNSVSKDITVITDNNTTSNSMANDENQSNTSLNEEILDEKSENNSINTNNSEVED